jgi:hypothetical protein
MRTTALTVCALLLCSSLNAEPRKHWYRDWHAWAVIGLAIGAGTFHAKSVNDCRTRAGIDQCWGHYGPRVALEGVNIGVGAGFTALSLWARHDDMRAWWSPVTGWASWNFINGVQQNGKHCKTLLIAGQCQDSQ